MQMTKIGSTELNVIVRELNYFGGQQVAEIKTVVVQGKYFLSEILPLGGKH